MIRNPIKIVIAGGGTGGHLFPGVAAAEAFLDANPSSRVLFVSAGNPFEKRVLSEKGFALESVPAGGVKGLGIRRQMTAAAKIPLGVAASLKILSGFRPDVILGVGSYASAPVVLAGRIMGIPVALHEQNSLPGVANRLLAPLASAVFVSFETGVKRLKARHIRVTGNPVRKEIRALAPQPPKRPSETDRFTVLIVGGSQGARALNQAVTDALPVLRGRDRFHFIHQTGADDPAGVAVAYKKEGTSCETAAFFSDMAALYASADLVVCRAGATTVAELAVAGKPALFIPFPHAADDHQVWNARFLAEAGAADMILQKDLSGPVLAERIMRHASRPDALARMASRSRRLGRPGAAEEIVDACYQLIA